MKKNCLALLILVSITKFCLPSILSISIPKAGTYLLAKTIWLIMQEKFPNTDQKDFQLNCHPIPSYEPSIDELRKMTSLPFSGFHLAYKPEFENLLKSEGTKVFFIKRDPRDQLVSQAYFMLQESQAHGRFTFDSLLSALIGG